MSCVRRLGCIISDDSRELDMIDSKEFLGDGDDGVAKVRN